MTSIQIHEFAKEILQELDHFNANFRNVPIQAVTAEVYRGQWDLRREGPIGYLRVRTDNEECCYVLCRSETPHGIRPAHPGADYLNYQASLGRIASLKVGETLDGHTVLLAKDIFRTESTDAVENALSPPLPELQIPSLREFLSGNIAIDLAAPRKRPAIEAISLRNQAVVDRNQDPLFRLSVNAVLVISGSPGTGKTTVMIKRLAIKTRRDRLTVDVDQVGNEERLDRLFVPERSWMLFTPTELLKSYIKESLGRDGMVATEQTVRIWNEYRTEIARDCLRLLKVGKKAGAFRRIGENEQMPVSDDKIRQLFFSFEQSLQGSDIEQRAEQRIVKRLMRRREKLNAETAGSLVSPQPTDPQRLAEYVRLVPKYYKVFRRRNPLLADFYRGKVKSVSITEHELDVIILVILKRFRTQMKAPLLRGDDSLGNPDLDLIASLLRTVVAVDEATDFSSVQLGCMYALTHPRFNSFTLCGDLMQRLTTYGLSSWEDLNSVLPNVQVEELSRSYRQSPRLLHIATDLYQLSIGQVAPFRSAFDESEYEQVPPLLLENTDDSTILSNWLCERVIEIFEIHQRKLPSIAIFVPSETDIKPLYDGVFENLRANGIDVEDCPGGRVLGNQAKVRIFSVAFIKGLEFEAVFFAGLDMMRDQNASLVNRFLYVGVTRARTFLGVTSHGDFPAELVSIKRHFETGNWSDLIAIPDVVAD